ncbi:MAG: (2Fe-2S)-binding protein [Syntrophales bacterium]
MSEDIQRRIPNGSRGPKIQFELDGEPAVAYEGETIAAALLALGIRTFRVSPKEKEPRGLHCGMGVCFDCIVTVNDQLNVRACMTPVEKGMKVETGAKIEKRPITRVKE